MVAYERYLTLGTNQHFVLRLATQRRNKCDNMCGEVLSRAIRGEYWWNIGSLATVSWLKRTGVRCKLHEVQDTCRAERQKVFSFMTKLVERATSIGNARKEKAELVRGSAQVVSNFEKFRTDLEKAWLVAQVEKAKKGDCKRKWSIWGV